MSLRVFLNQEILRSLIPSEFFTIFTMVTETVPYHVARNALAGPILKWIAGPALATKSALALKQGVAEMLVMPPSPPVVQTAPARDPPLESSSAISSTLFGVGVSLTFFLLAYCNARRVSTRILYLGNRVVNDAGALRAAFMDLVPIAPTVAQNHTHAAAASCRSSATNTMTFFATLRGLVPYFTQLSRSDQRRDRLGFREYYWGKDVTTRPQHDELPANALRCIVDVDMYLDMPKVLCESTDPVCLYTFQPHAVARASGNYSFSFREDNTVNYIVTGGGRFTHSVWNYGSDNVIAVRSWMGIPYHVATHLIDRKAMSEDRELILFTPTGSWYGLLAPIAYLMISGPTLRYLKPVQGLFTRLTIRGPEHLVSTGRVNEFTCATVPVGVDEHIRRMVDISKNDINMAVAETAIGGEPKTPDEYVQRKQTAAVLVAYHRSGGSRESDVLFPVDPTTVRGFQFGNYDVDAKPSMTPFMKPLMDGCFAPDRTPGNEQRAVDKRIKLPCDAPMTPFLATIIEEFVSFLIPIAGQLVPHEYEDVYERQVRKTQRSITEAAASVLPHRIIKFFIKSEAYAEPNDPRIISTFNGTDKTNYSKYIYPLADSMKKHEWYAFGMKPLHLAQCLGRIALGSAVLVMTDFSRFDGRVSTVLRHLESAVLMRAFPPAYHTELDDLHRAHFNNRAVGTFGTRYEQETRRGSGEMGTSIFNTLANAFTSYLAGRMTKTSQGWMSPQEAWNNLGLYGGDDGVSRSSAEMLEKAARMVGQVMKADEVRRGEFGVKFLARVYGPNIWWGNINSCCDLPRQLAKFHATPNLPPGYSSLDKLAEKCRSFVVTDKHTPIIGEFVCQVLAHMDCSRLVTKQIAELKSWSVSDDPDCQYPNENDGWMDWYASEALAFDRNRFDDWLALSYDEPPEYFLSPPLCIDKRPPKVVGTCVVDGEVHPLILPPPPRLTRTPRKSGPPTKSGPSRRSKSNSPARAAGEGTGT